MLHAILLLGYGRGLGLRLRLGWRGLPVQVERGVSSTVEEEVSLFIHHTRFRTETHSAVIKESPICGQKEGIKKE